jgi:hypothetical protein
MVGQLENRKQSMSRRALRREPSYRWGRIFPVPTFNVIYRFTCPTCAHPNEGETDVEADDKVIACQIAFKQVGCADCMGKLLSSDYFFTSIRQI